MKFQIYFFLFFFFFPFCLLSQKSSLELIKEEYGKDFSKKKNIYDINSYKYFSVISPKYENGIDIYGYGDLIRKTLSKRLPVLDGSQEVVDMDVNEAIIVYIEHSTSIYGYLTVTLNLHSVRNHQSTIIKSYTASAFSNITPKSAIHKVCRKLFNENYKYNGFDSGPSYLSPNDFIKSDLISHLNKPSDQLMKIEGFYNVKKGYSNSHETITEDAAIRYNDKIKCYEVYILNYEEKLSINGFIINLSNDYYIYKHVQHSGECKVNFSKLGFNFKQKFVGFESLVSYTNQMQLEKNDNDFTEGVKENRWNSNGTGFFVSPNGFIATNYHVVKDANEIEIEYLINGERKIYSAQVIQSDTRNDLSIIKIIDNDFKLTSSIPYNFKTTIADLGEEVYSLGYPLALSLMGKSIKFTDGKISSKTGMQGDITTYQISVPIQPGNSGGPLFDMKGNLIGITSSTINRSLDITENVNYAIKSSYLKNLIDVLDENIKLPSSSSLAQVSLTDQINLLSDYVVLIKIR